MAKIAHKIKGISGNTGGRQLFQNSAELELAAKNCDQDNVSLLQPLIQPNFRDLSKALKEFKATANRI